MGTNNLRRKLSSLQTELEALVWAMQSMIQHNKCTMYFETDCSDVVKMVSAPEECRPSRFYWKRDKCKKSSLFAPSHTSPEQTTQKRIS